MVERVDAIARDRLHAYLYRIFNKLQQTVLSLESLRYISVPYFLHSERGKRIIYETRGNDNFLGLRAHKCGDSYRFVAGPSFIFPTLSPHPSLLRTRDPLESILTLFVH